MAIKNTTLYKKDGHAQIIGDNDTVGKGLLATFINQDKNSPIAAIEVVASMLHENETVPSTWLQIIPRDGSTLRVDDSTPLPPTAKQLVLIKKAVFDGDKGELAKKLSQLTGYNITNAGDMLHPIQPVETASNRFIRRAGGIKNHGNEIQCYSVNADVVEQTPDRRNMVTGKCLKELFDGQHISSEIYTQATTLIDKMANHGLLNESIPEQKRICGEIMGKGRGGEEQGFAV